METSKFEKRNSKVLIEIIKSLKSTFKNQRNPRYDDFGEACDELLNMLGFGTPEFIDINYLYNCYILNEDDIDNPSDFIRPIKREWNFKTKHEIVETIEYEYSNNMVTYGDGRSTTDYINFCMTHIDYNLDEFGQKLLGKQIVDIHGDTLYLIKGSLKQI
jgi:hypothetical protein